MNFLPELVVGSITLVTLGSLKLVATLERRFHQRENVGDEEILPYETVTTTTPCQKCGTTCAAWGGSGVGPRAPRACRNSDDCPVGALPHLHMSCNKCGSDWFMAPRSAAQHEEGE